MEICMDIKHNNKSQSQQKHPTQYLQREEPENWAKKTLRDYSTKPSTKQEQLQYKSLIEPCKLSNDYVLEPPAPTSN